MVPTMVIGGVTVDVGFLSFELGESLDDSVCQECPTLQNVFQHTFHN